MASTDASDFRLSVLNPGGRDLEQYFDEPDATPIRSRLFRLLIRWKTSNGNSRLRLTNSPEFSSGRGNGMCRPETISRRFSLPERFAPPPKSPSPFSISTAEEAENFWPN